MRPEACFVRGADGALLRTVRREATGTPKGTIVTLHGLGEHVGKYTEWLDAARARGFHVTAWDQRGHGRTPGRRGDFRIADLVADLAAMMADVGARHPTLPRFVVGHSLGALVAIGWAARGGAAAEGSADSRVAGIALSNPPLALARETPGWYSRGVRLLARVAPGLPLPRRTDPARLLRDPERVSRWREDRLVHRVMTPRAMVSTAEAMARAREVTGIGAPLLVLVSDADPVASAPAARAWAEWLESDDVTIDRIADALHEILYDTGREAIFARILDWCEDQASTS